MSKKLYSKDQIQLAVSNSKCYADVLRNLGLTVNGGSYPWLKSLIAFFEINLDHFYSDGELRQYRLGKLGENQHRKTGKSLRLLLSKGNIDYCCNICKIKEWMNQEICLDVDHIDNNPTNNDILNLQYLCPNCHRQKTLKERPQKNKKVIEKRTKHVKTKIDWPSIEDLQKMLWEKPTKVLAQELGVSDKAVEKRSKKLGLTKPPRGYWQKTERIPKS